MTAATQSGAVARGQPRTTWQQWVQNPQRLRLRKVVFQLHLWSGIGLGLYVLFISITGAVLVYRNELFAIATTDTQFQLVATLIDLHADLLGGRVGRKINGLGAFAVLLSALTGLFLWWPGIKRWRRSLTLHRGVGWKRLNWDLHSAMGFWSFAFTVVFAVSGLYLAYPESFHGFADWLDPPDRASPGLRVVDSVLAWLAYSHFGRINGIGLACSGPGICDQTIKAIWALFGAAPAAMFVTGATLWWNRVLRPWRRRVKSRRSQ